MEQANKEESPVWNLGLRVNVCFAFMMVLWGCGLGNAPFDSTKLYQRYMDVPRMEKLEGYATDSLMELAFLAYLDQDFLKAQQHFSRITQIDSTQIYTLFFLGITHMQLEEYPAALRLFEEILASHPLYASSQWYSALAFLKLGKTEMTRKFLMEISLQPTHPKYAEAVELLGFLA